MVGPASVRLATRGRLVRSPILVQVSIVGGMGSVLVGYANAQMDGWEADVKLVLVHVARSKLVLMMVLTMGAEAAFIADLVQLFNHPSGVVFHLVIVVVSVVVNVGHRIVTHIILDGIQIAIVLVEE
eukprot:SAG11_NODE_10481_length_828_cov_3.032922_1_plen_127_part_00